MSISLTKIQIPSGQGLDLSYSTGNPQSLVSTWQLAVAESISICEIKDWCFTLPEGKASKNVALNSQVICSIRNVKYAYFIFLVFPMKKVCISGMFLLN